MKSICTRALSIFLLVLTIATSVTAFAQQGDIDRPFDFTVKSECEGCVSFGDFHERFELVTAGTPVRIRFYYSNSWYAQPDETSEYFELPISVSRQTGEIEIPEFTLGNWSTGSRFNFAYGLVSENGHLLWFMTEAEYDSDRHTIDIE